MHMHFHRHTSSYIPDYNCETRQTFIVVVARNVNMGFVPFMMLKKAKFAFQL